MDIGELNRLYDDAESCDSDLFSEQRSNVLLVSGNHYARRGSKYQATLNNLRRSDKISRQQKIRLTKNHIQKISKTYVNNILTYAPGVTVRPRNLSELSDQKAAELNKAVWHDLKKRHQLKEKTRKLASDYVDLGEAAIKVFFDPNAGDFIGYEPVLNEEGMPTFDENGEPVAVSRFTGDLVFERILAFNLMRDPEAKDWEGGRYVIYRKMVSIRDLRNQFKGDEEKLSYINESSDKTYQVFDGSTGQYSDGKDMVMVREYYFRPSQEYPNGWYYIATEDGILHEGEIPLGVFPIIYVGFDEFATSARAHSIIKQLRPFQAEVNRCASKIAEHQITIGDDKIVLSNGSSMTPGGTAHGVKAIKVTGNTPIVMPGRTGEQFLSYMQSQISEMYAISNVAEDSQEKMTQVDPYAMLFKGIKDKKKFVVYTDKFVEFLIKICEVSLRLAKAYFPEAKVIPMFDKKEVVNIAEWKATEDIAYQIEVEEQGEDAESKMGRQLSLNHIIQYAGQNMDNSDMGKIIRAMPYINEEEIFKDLTIDYDNATNDILALDRGEFIPPNKYDTHKYVVKRLVNRMKQADFKFLSPQVQMNYQRKLMMHEQLIVKEEQDKMAVEAGYIPTGGYLVACDLYVPGPDATKLPKRARVPFEALQWLLKRLEQQGMSQASIEAMSAGVVSDMAQMGLGQQQQRLPAQPVLPGQMPMAMGGR